MLFTLISTRYLVGIRSEYSKVIKLTLSQMLIRRNPCNSFAHQKFWAVLPKQRLHQAPHCSSILYAATCKLLCRSDCNWQCCKISVHMEQKITKHESLVMTVIERINFLVRRCHSPTRNSSEHNLRTFHHASFIVSLASFQFTAVKTFFSLKYARRERWQVAQKMNDKMTIDMMIRLGEMMLAVERGT